MKDIPLTDHSDEVSRGMVDFRFGPGGVKALTQDQIARITSLREHARLLARHVLADVPPSWERDKALEDIDNALSWAARSISRNG